MDYFPTDGPHLLKPLDNQLILRPPANETTKPEPQKPDTQTAKQKPVPNKNHNPIPIPPKQGSRANIIPIDNKFFSFLLVGGRNYPICITERKFRKIMGKLWLGQKDLEWLGDCIEKAMRHQKDGEFVQHRRDGYKAIHAIRRSNQNGSFLEISEFHSGSRQGVLRVPAGMEWQGWVDFSKQCKGLWNINFRRKAEVGGDGNNKGKESQEPQIMQEDTNFKKPVSVAVNNAIGINTSLQAPETKVNARVELSIKLDLVCGPTGVWEVARAQVVQDNSKAQVKANEKALKSDLKKSVGPIGPINKQPTRVWQPISKPSHTKIFQPVHGSSSTMPTPEHLKASCVGPHCEISGAKKSGEAFEGCHRELDCEKIYGDEVDVMPLITITENESSGWAMKLRDGRKLTMPSFPPVSLSANPFYALSSKNINMERSIATVSASEEWTEMGENVSEPSQSWVNSEIEVAVTEQGGEWEDEVMWVEPLVVAMPVVEDVVEKIGSLGFGESVPDKAKDHTKTLSEWVTDKMQEFGLYLGASYEGFEDIVMKLLSDIELLRALVFGGIVSSNQI